MKKNNLLLNFFFVMWVLCNSELLLHVSLPQHRVTTQYSQPMVITECEPLSATHRPFGKHIYDDFPSRLCSFNTICLSFPFVRFFHCFKVSFHLVRFRHWFGCLWRKTFTFFFLKNSKNKKQSHLDVANFFNHITFQNNIIDVFADQFHKQKQ